MTSIFSSLQNLAVFVLFLLSLATCTVSCASVQDCSQFKSYERCNCIKDNGDLPRYKECHKLASEKAREAMRKDCWRRCYDDCKKCEEI